MARLWAAQAVVVAVALALVVGTTAAADDDDMETLVHEHMGQEHDMPDTDEYSPHAFFKMHDMDGDGFLSEKELFAVYRQNVDRTQAERMMRQVWKHVDTDGDKRISEAEFLHSMDNPPELSPEDMEDIASVPEVDPRAA